MDRVSRVVDDSVVTSAGVASGIDMSFYVVEQLHGRGVADETARYIEYRRVDLRTEPVIKGERVGNSGYRPT